MALEMRLVAIWRSSCGREVDGDAGLVVAVDADVLHLVAMAEDGEDIFDGLAEIEVGAAGVGADEAEGEAGDVAEAGELAFGGLEPGAGGAGEGGVGAGEVEEVDGGLERVVDLVGDGGGEAAHGGEFFGAEEGGLGELAVGDVDGDAAPEAGVAVGAGAAALEPVELAVGPEDAELEDDGVGGGAHLVEDGGELWLVVGMEQETEGFERLMLLEGPAEDLEAAGVPVDGAIVGEVEGPGGAVAVVQGLDEGVGALLEGVEERLRACRWPVAAAVHQADEDAEMSRTMERGRVAPVRVQ